LALLALEDKSRKLAETQPDSPQWNGMDIVIEDSRLRQALDVAVDQIDLSTVAARYAE
jgi:hypothetical protein